MIELSQNISVYIQQIFGEDFLNNYRKFVESNYNPFIRISQNTDDINELLISLKSQGVELEKIDGIPKAYKIIKGKDIIGKTVEHLLGKYYIQSLSSMIPPLILNPDENDRVMDLCAAPGSKSTQLSELMNYRGTLYSNEPNLNRVKALVHNLDKMNAINMSVIKDKGELLSKKFSNHFEKILVDAPCSALGVIQKKQEVSNWWNSKTAEKISSLQLKLLISAIKMAKVGGEIVYSTCTLTVEENEFVIDKVLKKYPVKLVEFDLPLKHTNGFIEISNFKFDKSLELTKRIIPWEIKSEGFFIAKLIKTKETENFANNNKEFSKKYFVNIGNKKVDKYLNQISEHFGIPIEIIKKYKYLINNKDINFINADAEEYRPDFFLRVGTKFGIIDKNDSCKLHSHAAQILGKYAILNIFEILEKDELKTYFSGGTIFRENVNKGQKIVKFKNLFIGTGIMLENKLKSQFPRSKRTGNILI